MEQTRAVIKTKFGDITLGFFPDVAPNHVSSFLDLARSGFFDGTTFHRVVPGFVIQGGDPNSKNPDRSTHGTGGPGYYLKAEFSDRPHLRGTLSMARAADPDSAGSQFFICVQAAPFLDGNYTVFGEVLEGMDVVDKIVSQPRDERDNPIERIEQRAAGALMNMMDDREETARPEQQDKARDEELTVSVKKSDEFQFGRDFFTGCLAIIVIAVILFVIIPVLIFVLKLSFMLVLPVGLLAILVILTTFFGRIINILRKNW
ncbi:MAG: peptidylprolyl isomerase [Deltaproteobacteria bacterium]|nr:peptidylprolyl isomerase [Deltaproteobacteria bacterium]